MPSAFCICSSSSSSCRIPVRDSPGFPSFLLCGTWRDGAYGASPASLMLLFCFDAQHLDRACLEPSAVHLLSPHLHPVSDD